MAQFKRISNNSIEVISFPDIHIGNILEDGFHPSGLKNIIKSTELHEIVYVIYRFDIFISKMKENEVYNIANLM